jgi:hypothetical protein
MQLKKCTALNIRSVALRTCFVSSLFETIFSEFFVIILIFKDIASGSSTDWAYQMGITHSYCLELRPGRKTADSSYGFLLPEDRAPFVGEETYQGLKALFLHIMITNQK